jgi:hypothetical protein
MDKEIHRGDEKRKESPRRWPSPGPSAGSLLEGLFLGWHIESIGDLKWHIVKPQIIV